MLLNIVLDESLYDALSQGERVRVRMDDVVVEIIRRREPRTAAGPIGEIVLDDRKSPIEFMGGDRAIDLNELRPRYMCPQCNNMNEFKSLCAGNVDGETCGFDPLKDGKRWEEEREAEMDAFERENPIPDAAATELGLIPDNGSGWAPDPWPDPWQCLICKNWNNSSHCLGPAPENHLVVGQTVCARARPATRRENDPLRYTCPQCQNVNPFDSLCVAQMDNGTMCGFNPVIGS